MFQGCFIPCITPFTKEGKIDQRAFDALIEWYVQEGVDSLVVCGTTAETPTLSEEEQEFLLRRAVDIVKRRIPVIAGTGSNDTQHTVATTKRAKEIGADGALVVVPYYNRPTFEGCCAHFQEVAKAGLPMIFYYHPGRTGVKLSPKNIAAIAELPEVVAIKEASGDIEAAVELIHLTSKPVLSGDDVLTLPMMAMGGLGCISIIANVIPKEWKKMISAFALGEVKVARALFQKYYRLAKALVMESNPQGLKYALSLMGKCECALRLPMLPPSEATQKEISEAMEELGLGTYPTKIRLNMH